MIVAGLVFGTAPKIKFKNDLEVAEYNTKMEIEMLKNWFVKEATFTPTENAPIKKIKVYSDVVDQAPPKASRFQAIVPIVLGIALVLFSIRSYFRKQEK